MLRQVKYRVEVRWINVVFLNIKIKMETSNETFVVYRTENTYEVENSGAYYEDIDMYHMVYFDNNQEILLELNWKDGAKSANISLALNGKDIFHDIKMNIIEKDGNDVYYKGRIYQGTAKITYVIDITNGIATIRKQESIKVK